MDKCCQDGQSVINVADTVDVEITGNILEYEEKFIGSARKIYNGNLDLE